MNEKTENISCKDCKYYIDYTGVAMCYHTRGIKQLLCLILLGPKPLFRMDACECFACTKAKSR